MASGGARKGAGRPRNLVGEIKRDMRSAAQPYVEAAVAEIANIMLDHKVAVKTRLAAAIAIRDMYYGRPVQSKITTDAQAPVGTITMEVVYPDGSREILDEDGKPATSH